MTNLSPEMTEDLAHERIEWLQAFGLKEADVMRDRQTGKEFIFSSSEGEDCSEHLTRIFLPYHLTSDNIYN